jgi:hypothetical protein
MIKGTVIDTAAGTKQPEQIARFPNGVPAVSDANMSDWMAYVYMQKPRPTDVVGVEVTLSVHDPSGADYQIGKTTTDSMGLFSFMWQPPTTGKYTVTATFGGSESYWPSSAETALGVTAAPSSSPSPSPSETATATPTPTPNPTATNSPSPVPIPSQGFSTELYITAAAIAVIAIIIAAAVILRRRK